MADGVQEAQLYNTQDLLHLKLIDVACETHLGETNPKYSQVITNARQQFFTSKKFTIYARLFAQILRVCDDTTLLNIDVVKTVFFEKNVHKVGYRPFCISHFSCRYALFKFVLKYCGQNQMLELLFSEYILLESISDPYHISSLIP